MSTFPPQFGPAGGLGGATFRDSLAPGERLAAIQIASGTVIDSIQMIGQKGGSVIAHPRRGGGGGTVHVFPLDVDEFLTEVVIGYASVVNMVQLNTNKKSLWYGSWAGRICFYSLPPGFAVAGLFGFSATYLDALGVIALPP